MREIRNPTDSRFVSDRTPSGQRIYPESAVERVRLIQQFFTAGLPGRTIVQLLPCVDTGRGSPRGLRDVGGRT